MNGLIDKRKKKMDESTSGRIKERKNERMIEYTKE